MDVSIEDINKLASPLARVLDADNARVGRWELAWISLHTYIAYENIMRLSAINFKLIKTKSRLGNPHASRTAQSPTLLQRRAWFRSSGHLPVAPRIACSCRHLGNAYQGDR